MSHAGGTSGSSIATTQANSARELSNQEVAFRVRLRGPLRVAVGASLLDIVFDLREAPPWVNRELACPPSG